MKSKPLIITLDGPSGSGKSTASIRLAKYFHIPCLDTGAMYRTVGLKALERSLDLDNDSEVAKLAEKLGFAFGFEGDARWVSVEEAGEQKRMGNEIRTPQISLAASRIAKLPVVRQVLVKKQQEIGQKEGAVVEGRDAGTVIFPKATIKFFLTATPEQRALRRHKELVDTYGLDAQTYEDVLREIILRDKQDEQREASPSKPAVDALLVDTSDFNLDQTVSYLIQKIEGRFQKKGSSLKSAFLSFDFFV